MWNAPSSPVGPVRFRSLSRSDSASPHLDSGRDVGVSFDIIEVDTKANTNTTNKNKENQQQSNQNPYKLTTAINSNASRNKSLLILKAA